MLGWIGGGLVVMAAVATQAPPPVSVDGNAITLTAVIGVALMSGKALQRLSQVEKDVGKILRRLFPEDKGE